MDPDSIVAIKKSSLPNCLFWSAAYSLGSSEYHAVQGYCKSQGLIQTDFTYQEGKCSFEFLV